MQDLSRRHFISIGSRFLSLASLTGLPVNAMMLNRGEEFSTDLTEFGFQGYRKEVDVGIYHTGDGYRLYDPKTRRFMQYDRDMSPYGQGGINGYMFSGNDPINCFDAGGRFQVVNFLRSLTALALIVTGTVLTLKTGGLSTVGLKVFKAKQAFGLAKWTMNATKAAIDAPDSKVTQRLTYGAQASGMTSSLIGGVHVGLGTVNAGARRLGLITSTRTGIGKKASLGKQFSHAGKAAYIDGVSQGGLILGDTFRSIGIASDMEVITFAGDMTKFAGILVGIGNSTYGSINFATATATGQADQQGFIKPEKRLGFATTVAELLFETEMAIDSIVGITTGSSSGLNPHSAIQNQDRPTQEEKDDSYTSPSNINKRSRHCAYRHSLYDRKTNENLSRSFGFENLAGA